MCEGYFEKYENIHQVNPIGAPYHLEISMCYVEEHGALLRNIVA